MPKSFSFNLNKLWKLPEPLISVLEDSKYHENFSGEIEFKEKYKNGNSVFSAFFDSGILKESIFYYPTGEKLCVEEWEGDHIVCSQQFHYNKKPAQIEKYKDGVIISSQSFGEDGEKEGDHNPKEDFSTDLSSSISLTTRMLVKNWLENGWEE